MSTTSAAPFDTLSSLCKDMSALSGISGILGWDEQVMMPSGAAASRGAQKAALAAVLHDKATSAELAAAIQGAKEVSDLGPFERATVRDAERDYKLAVGVPAELERKIAANEVASVQAWVSAREKDDYSAFEDNLRQTLALTKEKAQAMRPGELLYDTLIDQFERGMSAQRLSEIFDSISKPLKTILDRVLEMKEKKGRDVHPALRGGEDWDVTRQAELSKDICQILGFDMDKGRIGKCTKERFFANTK